YYNHPEDYLFQDVTETFEAGIMYSILGQSGSGKTTLLSLLAGAATGSYNWNEALQAWTLPNPLIDNTATNVDTSQALNGSEGIK
ncbi:ATP-binding cassette domain-containing protein, partial [Lactococcus petauri]|uniref:ATP-binding cassette domain-containing protein n=1 Tax=Lactococcus petauri TaxID=1940789 RepID=UPI0023EC575A